jgi:hypothetical protein
MKYIITDQGLLTAGEYEDMKCFERFEPTFFTVEEKREISSLQPVEPTMTSDEALANCDWISLAECLMAVDVEPASDYIAWLQGFDEIAYIKTRQWISILS